MNEHDLKEDIFNILRILSLDGKVTQRDLSNHLQISLGKTNYLLKALAGKGFVRAKNFARKDQRLKRVRYILTAKGLQERTSLTYYFLKRKEKEYIKLRKELQEIPYDLKLNYEKRK